MGKALDTPLRSLHFYLDTLGALEDFKQKESMIRSAFLVILPAVQGVGKLRA